MYFATDKSICNIDALRNIPVPTQRPWPLPEGRHSAWKPIAHVDLVEGILGAVRDLGAEGTTFIADTTRGGLGLVGCVYVDDGRQARCKDMPGRGVRPAIGFRHSNDGREVVKIAFGGQVFVCTNGLFVGEFISMRRHVETLDLKPWLAKVVRQFSKTTAGLMIEFVGRLSKTPLDDHAAMRLLLRAATDGVLPAAHLAQCWEEWLSPKHRDFEPRTAWSLHNAITEVMKARSPSAQLESGSALPALFSEGQIRWAQLDAGRFQTNRAAVAARKEREERERKRADMRRLFELQGAMNPSDRDLDLLLDPTGAGF